MPICRNSAARVLCAALVALPLMGGTLYAQEVPRLERGTHIRFSPLILDQHLPRNGNTGGPVIATVVSTSPDTIVVRVHRGGAHVSLPWDDFRFLERSTGLSVIQATLLGAALGSGAGAALGALTWEAEVCGGIWHVQCNPNPNSRTTDAQAGGFGGAVLGTLAGYTLSKSGAFEHWTPVPLPPRIELSPGSDRLGVSASVPF